ncbi:BQ5605_C001g00549 [Microbotryum silenes-dioicae]|uniref:non-specific serine/threonine protein kinase n=1 Tax=Microbotryum silenes-dioicae TaxID=796604 RepID=A0A2X0M717_9BASI|nr:BQ5605_C001g00549 [Microbotryum silenes-dioicae]
MPTWNQRKRVINATLSSLARSLPSSALPNELLHLTLSEVERLAAQGQDVDPALLRLQKAVLSMDDFVVASTLSRSGSFASVQLVIAQKHLSSSSATKLAVNGSVTPRYYVVKTLDRSWGYRMQNFVRHELGILQQSLETPPDRRHTPTLIASFLSPERFHLVISHCPGGDLWSLLEATNANVAAHQRPDDSLVRIVGIEEGLVRGWMKELLEALEWLNSTGWAHRDVKPQNLLLNENGRLLLTDFGSAAPIRGDPCRTSTSHRRSSIAKRYCRALVGTPDYIAPEVLKYAESLVEQDVDESFGGGEPNSVDGDERAYGAEVDLWSFGVVIFELLTGQAPFFAESIAETYDRIINSATTLALPLPISITPAATSLISSLLVPASSRPSPISLRSHLFFKPLPSTSTYVPPAFKVPASTGTPSSPETSKADADDDVPQLFNFNSAFFSSPGLSILRPSPKSCQRSREQEEQYWKGIVTWMPDQNEFEQHISTISTESTQETQARMTTRQSTPLHPSISRHWHCEHPMTGTPISRLIGAQTPVPNRCRTSSTPVEEGDHEQDAQPGRGSSGRAKRNVSDLEAWKEMQERAWVVGMTGRKASAAKGVDQAIASPSDRLSKAPAQWKEAEKDDIVDGLRKRQEDVLRGIDGLEKKYESLFKLADAETARSSPNLRQRK